MPKKRQAKISFYNLDNITNIRKFLKGTNISADQQKRIKSILNHKNWKKSTRIAKVKRILDSELDTNRKAFFKVNDKGERLYKSNIVRNLVDKTKLEKRFKIKLDSEIIDLDDLVSSNKIAKTFNHYSKEFIIDAIKERIADWKELINTYFFGVEPSWGDRTRNILNSYGIDTYGLDNNALSDILSDMQNPDDPNGYYH